MTSRDGNLAFLSLYCSSQLPGAVCVAGHWAGLQITFNFFFIWLIFLMNFSGAPSSRAGGVCWAACRASEGRWGCIRTVRLLSAMYHQTMASRHRWSPRQLSRICFLARSNCAKWLQKQEGRTNHLTLTSPEEIRRGSDWKLMWFGQGLTKSLWRRQGMTSPLTHVYLQQQRSAAPADSPSPLLKLFLVSAVSTAWEQQYFYQGCVSWKYLFFLLPNTVSEKGF